MDKQQLADALEWLMTCGEPHAPKLLQWIHDLSESCDTIACDIVRSLETKVERLTREKAELVQQGEERCNRWNEEAVKLKAKLRRVEEWRMQLMERQCDEGDADDMLDWLIEHRQKLDAILANKGRDDG